MTSMRGSLELSVSAYELISNHTDNMKASILPEKGNSQNMDLPEVFSLINISASIC